MAIDIKSLGSWPGPSDAKQCVPEQILQVVSNELPLSTAHELIASNVNIVISGRTFSGIQFWLNWLAAVKKCSSESLSLRPFSMTTNNNEVEIKARFCYLKNGQKIYSDSITFYHWVENNKVVRMCTQWQNYEFVFGWMTRSIWYRPLLYCKIFWYLRREKSHRQKILS